MAMMDTAVVLAPSRGHVNDKLATFGLSYTPDFTKVSSSSLLVTEYRLLLSQNSRDPLMRRHKIMQGVL
ncbi:hypothetical protein HJFPF1_02534 [Paramyrothecium foliicola]|nr:hypothetical protein HJFPF1_02534 [Paramyrothecium foliicola]